MDGASKVRENRARRVAERQGYTLLKSRRRDPRALDFGLYALKDQRTRVLVNGPLSRRWYCTWTLDEVEEFLNRPVEGEGGRR